jgi:hypothetical protein
MKVAGEDGSTSTEEVNLSGAARRGLLLDDTLERPVKSGAEGAKPVRVETLRQKDRGDGMAYLVILIR